jgi:hypothetical protein
MPQGKGTYGKQVGRPPAKHIITDERKTEGHDRHNKRHADNPDYKHGKSTEKFPKAASPLEYAPFKMKAADYGNSPMQKNFGVGDSEMPIKTAPVKWGGFRGLASKLFGRNKEEQQPEQPQDPIAQATQAAQAQAQPQAQGTMMQQEMAAYGKGKAAAGGAEQAGGEEGGEVQPHGPEAHTGGAGPIGGAENKPGNFLFGSNKAKAGAGAVGATASKFF